MFVFIYGSYEVERRASCIVGKTSDTTPEDVRRACSATPNSEIHERVSTLAVPSSTGLEGSTALPVDLSYPRPNSHVTSLGTDLRGTGVLSGVVHQGGEALLDFLPGLHVLRVEVRAVDLVKPCASAKSNETRGNTLEEPTTATNKLTLQHACMFASYLHRTPQGSGTHANRQII